MVYRNINIVFGDVVNYLNAFSRNPIRLMIAENRGLFENEKPTADQFANANTQEVFYKLRKAISKTTNYEKSRITFETKFEELFSIEQRRRRVKELEKEIGYPVKLLKPKRSIINMLAILFFISVAGLFISSLYGIVGIILTMILFYISNNLGNEFTHKTVGQAAEKISIDYFISEVE